MRSVRELTIDIAGKQYPIASDDEYLTHVENGFEPDMVALFRAVASNSDVIVDVGANIGCAAILFGDLAQDVYAFEPSPSTFAFLSRNVVRSKKTNIHVRNVGLGAADGESTLTFAPTNRSGGFVSDKMVASEGHWPALEILIQAI